MTQDNGASLRDRVVVNGAGQAVSAVPASVPSADTWRTDSPPYGDRPIWQYVFLQGSSDHMGDGMPWARSGWGTAAVRTNDHADGLLGYRKSDIERICKDNDIDLWTVKLVGWLPMQPPALLTDQPRPALAPCDDGEWSAQAIEARSGETRMRLDPKDESAVPTGCAQPSPDLSSRDTNNV